MLLKNKGRQIEVEVKKLSSIGKIFGLMFRSRNTASLLFEFRKPTHIAIHSWFVGFSFYAIWLDSEGEILEYKLVKPFNFYVKPKKSFLSLVELPINQKNKRIVDFLVGKRKV
jgi:uncharacterized membrane protein (UPF0127 family)